MKDPFNPYHKWLGISPEDQPPHHYRLLGIEPFESDPDVIANAADGRMAQVKNFQIGKYSEHSQRILNEIAAARVCLLNPEKKEQYDRKLRLRLEAENQGFPQAAPPPVRNLEPEAGGTAERAMPAVETSSVFSYVSARSHARPFWLIPIALAAVAVTLGVLSIFIIARRNASPAAGQAVVSEARPEAAPPEKTNLPPWRDQDQQGSPPAIPKTAAKQPPLEPIPNALTPSPSPGKQGEGRQSQGKLLESPIKPDLRAPAADPGRLLADLLDPLDPEQRGDNGGSVTATEPPGRDLPRDAVAPLAKRLPVPDDDVQREAEQRIRQTFRKELAGAATPKEKLASAVRLAAQAEKTSNDPAARFVLMHFASEKGAEAGSLTMALDLVDRLRRLYDVDALTLKADLLDKAAAAPRTGTRESVTDQQIVEQAMPLADEAVAADDFDLAGRFVRLALSAARKMKDSALGRRLEARDREVGRMKLRFVEVRKALGVLAENPADGEANLTAGRWYCFSAGNPAKGLPLLAQGADAALAGLAKQDLDHPDDPKLQMKLADQWWDLGKKEKGPEQRGIQARARHWYELALPGLTGQEKTEVEKRLTELAAAVEPSGSHIRGIVQQGNVALASNGTKVIGVQTGGSFLLDGRAPEDRTGIAHGPLPCEWTITFRKVYELREIRFLLWDRDERYYRYVLATSVDGKSFTVLADRSRGQWSSWQRMTFPPRPVKAIKLTGLYNSKNREFHVVEFEAYCAPPRFPPPPRIALPPLRK
jgi:hypothetical protein